MNRLTNAMRCGTPRVVLGLLALVLASGCDGGKDGEVDAREPLSALSDDGTVPARIVLYVTPGAGARMAAERARPLAIYLERELDREVELLAASSYEKMVDAVKAGRATAAILSPVAWVENRDRLPVVPIASVTRGGTPTYVGYLVVSDLERFPTLESLRGSRVAWVDPTSSSGYHYPRALLELHGYDPETFFQVESMAGDHHEAIRRVVAGEADVAAVASSFVDPGSAGRSLAAESVHVVAKTGRIPLDCVVIHRTLDRQFAERLRDALFRLSSDPRASERLADSYGIDGFVKVHERRYDMVAELLAEK